MRWILNQRKKLNFSEIRLVEQSVKWIFHTVTNNWKSTVNIIFSAFFDNYLYTWTPPACIQQYIRHSCLSIWHDMNFGSCLHFALLTKSDLAPRKKSARGTGSSWSRRLEPSAKKKFAKSGKRWFRDTKPLIRDAIREAVTETKRISLIRAVNWTRGGK